MNFTGSVVELTGEPIFQRVSGTVSIRGQAWGGELAIESGEQPCTFRGYLVMDGGQQVEIFNQRLVIGGSTLQFEGAGPAPVDDRPAPGL
jgi:hypothetical protein